MVRGLLNPGGVRDFWRCAGSWIGGDEVELASRELMWIAGPGVGAVASWSGSGTKGFEACWGGSERGCRCEARFGVRSRRAWWAKGGAVRCAGLGEEGGAGLVGELTDA